MSVRHLAVASLLLALEVAIARFASGFVRTFCGDVLVVILLYCAIRSVLDLAPRRTMLSVWLFACALELGQAMQLVRRLGLEHNRLARIVIGTAYDPLDFVAYTLGAALVLLVSAAWTRGR